MKKILLLLFLAALLLCLGGCLGSGVPCLPCL